MHASYRILYHCSLLTDMHSGEPSFQATQPLEDEVDQLLPKDVWGYLVPHNDSMSRIDFVRPAVIFQREEVSKKLCLNRYGPQTVHLKGRQIS